MMDIPSQQGRGGGGKKIHPKERGLWYVQQPKRKPDEKAEKGSRQLAMVRAFRGKHVHAEIGPEAGGTIFEAHQVMLDLLQPVLPMGFAKSETQAEEEDKGKKGNEGSAVQQNSFPGFEGE